MTGGGLCSILIGGVSLVPLPIPDFSPPGGWERGQPAAVPGIGWLRAI